jgi:hypothetical protein
VQAQKRRIAKMSTLLLIGLVLCGLVLLATLAMGLITLLIKLGEYRLDQGREVVSEDRRQ